MQKHGKFEKVAIHRRQRQFRCKENELVTLTEMLEHA